jgi:hypothetical protein
VFSRADLFDKQQKRLRDTDRVEEPAFDNRGCRDPRVDSRFNLESGRRVKMPRHAA